LSKDQTSLFPSTSCDQENKREPSLHNILMEADERDEIMISQKLGKRCWSAPPPVALGPAGGFSFFVRFFSVSSSGW
jgi:hypothetical protein